MGKSDLPDDDLGKFIREMHYNEGRAVHLFPVRWRRLASTLALWSELTQRPLVNESPEPSYLLVRAKGSFLAAARLALCGQGAEASRPCRGVLECAAFALKLRRVPDSVSVWRDRHASQEALKACRRAFSFKPILEACIDEAGDGFRTMCNRVYDRTIDTGGHPNVGAVLPYVDAPVPISSNAIAFASALTIGPGEGMQEALDLVGVCGWLGLAICRHGWLQAFDESGLSGRIAEIAQQEGELPDEPRERPRG